MKTKDVYMYIYFSSCNVFENGCIYIYIYIYIYIEILCFDFPKYSARYVTSKVERNIYIFENRKKLHFHPDKPVS